MLNLKAIIPSANEALLSAAWQHERKGYKPRDSNTQGKGNDERMAKSRKLREDVFRAVAAGYDQPSKVARILKIDKSTAAKHIRALRNEGRVYTIGKNSRTSHRVAT